MSITSLRLAQRVARAAGLAASKRAQKSPVGSVTFTPAMLVDAAHAGRIHIADRVYAQAIKDAESLAVSRGADLAKLQAKQERAERRAPERDDTHEIDTYHARDVLGDEAAHTMRAYDVTLCRRDPIARHVIESHSYTIHAATPQDAAKAARAQHAAAHRTPCPIWRARLSKDQA